MKKCSLFLVMLFQLSSAFAVPCAKPQEMQAIRVRALQTELMIAGLSCNGQEHYNYFIANYQPQLKQYADTMRGYFMRSYGPTAELEMNQFITQLANESMTRSLRKGAKIFCNNARLWFDGVEKKNKKLHDISFAYHGEIRQCR